ncbi:40S ribosomal protein S7 [Anaeramoeba flamelloides]|uniref:40S ribosomal protein S7 n=2 Tax=Anaeramoeba flamelloides TaxID=1746091 RepID=A0AAV7ZRL0_9EUKA|nr:40S ribosomal protein S7 [Anaeramoeba flamelloides]
MSTKEVLSLRKIVKPKGKPTDLEKKVAQAFFNLEMNTESRELKYNLSRLYFSGAIQIPIRKKRKAIIVFVPVPSYSGFQKIHDQFVGELEKKFSGNHVVLVSNKRIFKPETKKVSFKQKRPMSRSLTNVHNSILENILYPCEVIGRRTHYHLNGKKTFKVILAGKDKTTIEGRLQTYIKVYKHLTQKNIVFDYSISPVLKKEKRNKRK